MPARNLHQSPTFSVANASIDPRNQKKQQTSSNGEWARLFGLNELANGDYFGRIGIPQNRKAEQKAEQSVMLSKAKHPYSAQISRPPEKT
jgi:hypothetical protein